MKTTLSLSCFLFALSNLQAQPATTYPMHFTQNGFVQNAGQFRDDHGVANKEITFMYAKDDFHLELTASGFSYELIRETPDVHNFPESGFSDPDDFQNWRDAQTTQESVSRIDVTLKGANPHPAILTDENTGTLYNYYLGKLAVVNVPSFNRVTYKNIYPNIDLVFEDHHSKDAVGPEYSFIVHPGGDAHQIKMKYTGAGNISLEDQHTLSVAMPQGFIKETGLRGYWREDGSASDVSYHFKNRMLSFNTSVDKDKTLIIDPSIIWGSYFGGKGSENWDTESEIALDGNNNVYLTGSTRSSNNIATAGAVMGTYGGDRDIFIAKFSLDGTQILWATYFGGSGMDAAYGVCCDSHNNVMITGFTESPNVITTPGVFQDTLLGPSDVVIAKFSTTGQLIWSTLMGGPDDVDHEHGRSMIRDANDNIYICGYSSATSNIATPGAYQFHSRAAGDAFLVKFNPNGQKIWGTYFGGGGRDRAHALCFDPFGHIYFVGTTKSKKFIAVNGFQSVYGGSEDAFIAKFDTAGAFYWSSYYGGSNGDRARGVKCDGVGNVYLDGWSNSSNTNSISTPNGFQPNPGGGNDGFLVKFTPAGNRVWGTYFGGNQSDIFYGMTIDPQANLYVCGSTASNNNIASSGAFQSVHSLGRDAMVAKFDSSGNRIWSTYLGGIADDDSYDIERDSSGMIYLDLDSFGPLPVTAGAYQTTVRGQDDLAVFEMNFNDTIGGNSPVPKLIEAASASMDHLKIYPNPSSGLMTAEFESSQKMGITLTVFDGIGRMVFSQPIQATEGINTFSLNLSELEDGIYVLQLQGR